jgi:hypothetical protein
MCNHSLATTRGGMKIIFIYFQASAARQTVEQLVQNDIRKHALHDASQIKLSL